jgi:hypothetical protein
MYICMSVYVCMYVNMTARFFDTSTNHKNPFVRAIGNYTITDLRQQHKKYINKRIKHILL